MATKKITDLTQLTDLDATDSFVVNDSGAGADKRVEFSDLQSEVLNGAAIGTSTAITELQVDNLNLNGNTFSSTDTNGNILIQPNGTGDVVINESGADVDFRVAGDTSTHLLFVDASTDRVGIGTSNPSYKIEIKGSEDIAQFTGENDGVNGAQITLFHDSSSPAANDVTGFINFSGRDSAGNSSIYSRISAISTNVTDTTESGAIAFSTRNSGSFAERLRIDSSGNVGIGTSSPSAKLHVVGGNIKVGNTYGIDFSDTADGSGTTTSEVLDDYEEGTWTPVYEGSTSNPTISYGSGGQDGWYTKIGNLVFLQFTIYTNSVTGGSGDLRIGGVPYAMDGTGNFPVVNGNLSEGSFFTSNGPTSFIISPDAVDGTTILVFPTTIADLASGTSQNRMRGTILYRTA